MGLRAIKRLYKATMLTYTPSLRADVTCHIQRI